MVKIKQFRYAGQEDTEKWTTDLFVDLGGEVTQLGIQAPPETTFYLNGFENPLRVGCTGIYELDLEGLTTLTELKFSKESLVQTIIVDVVYKTMDGV